MSQPPPLVQRLRDQRERHMERSKIVRAAFVIAGFTVLLAGIAMLLLPGPAFAVIPIGLAILFRIRWSNWRSYLRCSAPIIGWAIPVAAHSIRSWPARDLLRNRRLDPK